MFKLEDGRSELYQWDTGRYISTPENIDKIHFSNMPYGTSFVIEVNDNRALIPDELLQTCGILYCWAMIGTQDSEYTKYQQTFEVIKRAKPSDYVFTPTDQKTLDDLYDHMQETVNSELEKAKETGTFDGRSIIKTEINENYELVVYYSDGTSENVGKPDDVSRKRDIVEPGARGTKTRIYAVTACDSSNPQGRQTYVQCSPSVADAWDVVVRGAKGGIVLPKSDAINSNEAINKGYVDDLVNSKAIGRLWFVHTSVNDQYSWGGVWGYVPLFAKNTDAEGSTELLKSNAKYTDVGSNYDSYYASRSYEYPFDITYMDAQYTTTGANTIYDFSSKKSYAAILKYKTLSFDYTTTDFAEGSGECYYTSEQRFETWEGFREAIEAYENNNANTYTRGVGFYIESFT